MYCLYKEETQSIKFLDAAEQTHYNNTMSEAVLQPFSDIV